MHDYVYISKNEIKLVKKELIELIKLAQNEVREKFTFRFDFIGSDERNMVTMDIKSNVGYDFDVNIRVNDEDEKYGPKEIKDILIKGFNKNNKKFSYDYCEDSKRVITIKVKDTKNSKILHSCDFAIVNDCEDGRQQYIRFNKNQGAYSWEYQPKGFYDLKERTDWLKANGYWIEVRERYINNKNINSDPNKKSRSIFKETIDQIYNQYFEDDDEYDYDYDDEEEEYQE